MGSCRTIGIVAAMAVMAATLFAGSASAGEDYPDALLTTPMTPQTVAAGSEADAYAQGMQAYVWGYPLVRMERVARQYTEVPNPKSADQLSRAAQPDRMGDRPGDRRVEGHADRQ